MTEEPEAKPPRRKTRRDKIREEIEANRRGDYTVPTWVLFLALIALAGGLVLLVVLAQ
ncbi:MAG: hypothetical protein ACRDTM_07595 [Micromonosporaceae bacterium]